MGTQNSKDVDTLRQRQNNGEKLTPEEEQTLRDADKSNADSNPQSEK